MMQWLVDLFASANKRSIERARAVAAAQVALGLDPPKIINDPDALWVEIATNHCPDCGGEGFFEGPSGGMSTNISCATCKHRFNVTPILRIAERI